MSGRIIWRRPFTVILHIIISFLVNAPVIFVAFSVNYNSYLYVLGFYLLIGAGSIAIDMLLQRTRAVFGAGIVAFTIFAGIILFIIRPCIDTVLVILAPEPVPQPHELSSPAFAALTYIVLILLTLPLLTGLVFAGRESRKQYIPWLCGIAVWTGAYLEIAIPNMQSFNWGYIVVYIGGAIIYALIAEFGQFLRVLPEKYFQSDEVDRL